MIYFISVLCMAILYIVYKAYKNTQQISVNHIAVHDKNLNKYTIWQNINVLHISDMHLENISVSPDQLYEKLKDEKIDIIALTGDFLDRKRSIPRLIPYLQVLNRLNAKFGIYAVFGNHDYVLKGKHFAQLRQTLKDHGCKTLQNENDTIIIDGIQMNIIGIDDYSTNHSHIPASFSGIEEGYNLVLTHDPNIVLDMEHCDFDYLLSGHFHGGQIHWPKPYHLAKMGKLVKMNKIRGLHYCHGKPFYISEGLGQTAINIRIGSRPEITLHQLSISQTPMERNKALAAV